MKDVQNVNTATWVDERYAELLARLSTETLDASANALMGSLESKGRRADRIEVLRAYAGWLIERPISKVGYGISKPGTRVWLLAGHTDKKIAGLAIASADFNRHGKLVRPLSKGLALITRHAMIRLFERLRTNALGEVITRGLVPLTEMEPPEVVGDEATIRIPGVGRFEAVAEIDPARPDEIVWIVKTFIDD